jgi:hypothetical protein
MLHGDRINGVYGVAGADAPAHGDEEGWAVACADDDVRHPRRAVEVIPLLQGSLLALDDEQAFARKDEEALLVFLAVVHRNWLSRPYDSEVEAELREALALLEVAVHAELTAVIPLNVADVPNEPAHSGSRLPTRLLDSPEPPAAFSGESVSASTPAP